MSGPDDLRLYTVGDVEQRLQLTRAKVYDLIRSRQLRSITIGRARRIPQSPHRLSPYPHPGRTLITMPRKRPNGGGSIYQRKDGRYEAAAYVTHADGTTRRLRVYAATWDEANKALTKALADHHAGLPALATGGPSVAAYLDDWLENIARHHLRATTFPQYARTVHLHIVPYLGNKKLNKLTAQEVRTWYNTMRKTCQCCRQGIDAGRGLLR